MCLLVGYEEFDGGAELMCLQTRSVQTSYIGRFRCDECLIRSIGSHNDVFLVEQLLTIAYSLHESIEGSCFKLKKLQSKLQKLPTVARIAQRGIKILGCFQLRKSCLTKSSNRIYNIYGLQNLYST